jgi:hypothetical protein
MHMSEPHFVGINEAARLTGKNKATISRDTKTGKLTATTNDTGAKRYQVAELERVYGTLRSPTTGYAPVDNHRTQPQETTNDTSALTEVVKAKDEMIALLKDQVDDLKRERDNWRDQAQRALPAPVDTTPATSKTNQRKGWWLFGRKATA